MNRHPHPGDEYDCPMTVWLVAIAFSLLLLALGFWGI